MENTSTPPPVAGAENLEALITAGLETTPDAPGRDLMSDFTDELTKDLPVQVPGEPAPKATEEKPVEENPPEKKPVAEGEEVPELPENAPKATKESWNRLRERGDRHKAEADTFKTEAETHKAALAALQKENEDLKAKAAKVPEYEDRLKTFDEMEAELAVTRIESTSEYKKAIAEPFKVLDSAIDTLVKSNEGTDVDAFFRMVQEADPAKQRAAFKELTSGWDQVDAAEGWSMVKSARELFDKQDAMRQNAHATAKERETMAATAAAAAKEATLKQFREASDDAVKSLREKTPFTPLVEGETEDDRYARLAEKLKSVDFDAQTPRGKAFAAAAALELPNAIRALKAKDVKIAELEARVAEFSKRKPNSDSKDVTPAAKPASDDDNLFDFENPAVRMSHSLNVVGG